MLEPHLMNESVSVKLPGGPQATVWVPVKGTESDHDVASRLVKTRSYPPGTVVTVDGTKFKVVSQEPAEIVELKARGTSPSPPVEGEETAPKSEKKPTQQVAPQVGQRWVTKDPRRKQEPFEVVSINGDHLVSDKGVKIQLHRLSRYRLVG